MLEPSPVLFSVLEDHFEGLKIYPCEQVFGVDVDLLLNEERFRRINKAIEAKYFLKLDIGRSRIAI